MFFSPHLNKIVLKIYFLQSMHCSYILWSTQRTDWDNVVHPCIHVCAAFRQEKYAVSFFASQSRVLKGAPVPSWLTLLCDRTLNCYTMKLLKCVKIQNNCLGSLIILQICHYFLKPQKYILNINMSGTSCLMTLLHFG